MLKDGWEMDELQVEIHRKSTFSMFLCFKKTDQAEGKKGKILTFKTYYFLGILLEINYLILKI